jgi:CHASE3 domain sensor protein
MAEELRVLSSLKNKFAYYDDYERCLADLNRSIVEINRINKESAGQDTIGKTYHQQVDKPTENLTETIKYIRKRLGSVVEAGNDTVDTMKNSDDEAGQTVDTF